MHELLKDKTIEPKVIYGDTDSVFFSPHITNKEGKVQTDKEALRITIQLGIYASHTICLLLPEPQEQAYEKTLYPFMILTKKRYVGNLYERDPDKMIEQKSMGIVLKRRDNAPIVKIVCGGIIDQILNKKNPSGAILYTKKILNDIVRGKFPIDKFVITKTLREGYVDRTRIAHAVLADRMTKRDPGNKPSSNDRIPYVYVETDKKKKLQGEKIEHVDFVICNNLKIDYLFYITNQIMKPALQFLSLIAKNPENIFNKVIFAEENKRNKTLPISHYVDIETIEK
jgi:DNA polymerase elongation subunit (family B)